MLPMTTNLTDTIAQKKLSESITAKLIKTVRSCSKNVASSSASVGFWLDSRELQSCSSVAAGKFRDNSAHSNVEAGLLVRGPTCHLHDPATRAASLVIEGLSACKHSDRGVVIDSVSGVNFTSLRLADNRRCAGLPAIPETLLSAERGGGPCNTVVFGSLARELGQLMEADSSQNEAQLP